MFVARTACVLFLAPIPIMVYLWRGSTRAGALHLPAESRELYAYTADDLPLRRAPGCRLHSSARPGRPPWQDTPIWRSPAMSPGAFANVSGSASNCSRPLRSTAGNMLSAYMHPEVIQAYLDNEWAAGRMLGPFSAQALGVLPPLR